MLEEPKRTLRVRKNPKYLNSDEQDPDKLSFSQLKSNNDYNSTYAQKTQDAKTLLKFINKINKNYRAYQSEFRSQAILPEKNQITSKQKKVQPHSEIEKKPTDQSKDNKIELNKKSKQIYNTKHQNSISNSQTIKNTQSYINKLKQMGTIPSIANFGKGLCTDQLKKLQSLYPEMKNITYESLTQHTNPNLFSSQSIPKKSTEQSTKVPKQIFSQQKLFKRSAYHVAIAYHIYLKNLKQKQGVIGNEIDPTYYARRLKQGKPLR